MKPFLVTRDEFTHMFESSNQYRKSRPLYLRRRQYIRIVIFPEWVRFRTAPRTFSTAVYQTVSCVNVRHTRNIKMMSRLAKMLPYGGRRLVIINAKYTPTPPPPPDHTSTLVRQAYGNLATKPKQVRSPPTYQTTRMPAEKHTITPENV